MKRILTDDDIKKIWEGIIIISLSNVADFIRGGGTKPVTMSNGYMASLSIDILSEDVSMYHLSIANPKGKTGQVTAQRMAYEIFGEGYVQLDIQSISGCIQFIKEKENKRRDRKENKIRDIKENKKEEKIKYGKEVEGDVNNGVERGVKKKI